MARIIKAAYSKTFPITQFFEKIYLEAEINEGEDVRNVLYDLKRTVNDFFYESNKAAEKQMGAQVIEVEKPINRTQSIINDINTVTDLRVLESYSMIAKNNPEIKIAYDKKKEDLLWELQ